MSSPFLLTALRPSRTPRTGNVSGCAGCVDFLHKVPFPDSPPRTDTFTTSNSDRLPRLNDFEPRHPFHPQFVPSRKITRYLSVGARNGMDHDFFITLNRRQLICTSSGFLHLERCLAICLAGCGRGCYCVKSLRIYGHGQKLNEFCLQQPLVADLREKSLASKWITNILAFFVLFVSNFTVVV